ncbi:hypothetical protein [Dinoroseobacter shibae]
MALALRVKTSMRGETRTLAKVGRYGIIAAIDISDKNSKKSA